LRRKPDSVLKNLLIDLAPFFIELFDPLNQIVVGLRLRLFGKYLKVVGLAFFARFAFVPDFAENQFIEFIKRLGRVQLAAAPKRLMRLLTD
jgi:hypothetical protein